MWKLTEAPDFPSLMVWFLHLYSIFKITNTLSFISWLGASYHPWQIDLKLKRKTKTHYAVHLKLKKHCKLYPNNLKKKNRISLLPKITTTLRRLSNQKTAVLGFSLKSRDIFTRYLCLLSGTINFLFLLFNADIYWLIYISYLLSTSSTQDTGSICVYIASFLKVVLHYNEKNKISLGIYVKTGSETCHKRAPKIKVYERDNFQLEKEQVRFSANKTLKIRNTWLKTKFHLMIFAKHPIILVSYKLRKRQKETMTHLKFMTLFSH